MAECHLKSNWDGTLSWGGVQVENFRFYRAIMRLPVWGRPVVGGVGLLCMLTVAAFRSPRIRSCLVQVGDRPKLHGAGLGQVWRCRSFYQIKMGLPFGKALSVSII